MANRQRMTHVSAAPTNPHPAAGPPRFDVADLYRGPVSTEERAAGDIPLDERLRQAYFWIVNNAIISPHYDIEYDEGPAPSYQFGGPTSTVRLPSGQCYSSFVLLPLLTFAVRRRCLMCFDPFPSSLDCKLECIVFLACATAIDRSADKHGIGGSEVRFNRLFLATAWEGSACDKEN